jgi:hypothetical protein
LSRNTTGACSLIRLSATSSRASSSATATQLAQSDAPVLALAGALHLF